MLAEIQETFPLSRSHSIKGTRRLAREKSLQIVNAFIVSGTSVEKLFQHIFFREFNFGEDENLVADKLLTPEEVIEVESDIPIIWKEDEIKFGQLLIRHALSQKEYIDGLIDKFAENWELDRIAMIDRILMQIASVELMFFPEIPPKVSINEAIDIAKKYSTDKSGVFINGILDSIHELLKAEGKISKTGRGLIDK